MPLRLVYRSYGGENAKNRPPYYDKTLALRSFVQVVSTAVAEGAVGDVVFLNDGPVPTDRLALMTSAGRVVTRPARGMRASYWSALRYATTAGWPDRDLVHFSEDDYLYRPHAFLRLHEADRLLPHVAYFALYAETPSNRFYFRGSYVPPEPPNWRAAPPMTINGQTWHHAVATTSTFAGRVRALREDRSIFRQAMLPFRHSYLDQETCVVYQGFKPIRLVGPSPPAGARWRPGRLRRAGASPLAVRGARPLPDRSEPAGAPAALSASVALRRRAEPGHPPGDAVPRAGGRLGAGGGRGDPPARERSLASTRDSAECLFAAAAAVAARFVALSAVRTVP